MEQRHIVSNGIRVYSYCQPNLHSFCIGLYVKAGALYEQPGENGITHFLEHVLFRNLGGMPQRELYERLEGIGAYFNACTYKEFVQFYITAAPRHFNECAEIIAMLLAPLSVTARDVSIERKRVQSEIREEDYRSTLDFAAARETWQGSTLANPILGTITGIQRMGLAQLTRAKDTIFTADNLCFYVTGSYTQENIQYLYKQVEKHAVPQGMGLRRNIVAVPKSFQKRDCNLTIKNTKDMPSIYFSFDVEFCRYTMAEVHLLFDILFKGNLCRFQMQLSEESALIYSFDSVLDQYSNIGVINVEYAVARSSIYRALGITVELFRSMKTSIGRADISYHLPRYGDNYDMLLDDPERLNWDMAFDNFILERGYRSIEEIKALFKTVTPERLMQIAGEIFRPDNLIVLIKAPKSKCREERVREILSAI